MKLERFYAGAGERSEVAPKENRVLEGSEAERRKPVSTESAMNELERTGTNGMTKGGTMAVVPGAGRPEA